VSEPGVIKIGKKNYQTVALRVHRFRELHPISDGWAIRVSLHTINAELVVMRAEIVDPTDRVVATGTAEELRGSSNINRTSAVENCETSAIGRALAAAGFGGEEYATANEVQQAIAQDAIDPEMNSWPKDKGRFDMAMRKGLQLARDADVLPVYSWHKAARGSHIGELKDVQRHRLLDWAATDAGRASFQQYVKDVG